MTRRMTVVCGGKSPEHKISLLSAQNITKGLQELGDEVTVIYIDIKGAWFHAGDTSDFSTLPERAKHLEPLSVRFGFPTEPWVSLENPQKTYACDCVFPVLHGPMGEDGTVQGLLELLGVPYVGPDVLGSSLCMHKGVARDVLASYGIKSIPFQLMNKPTYDKFHALQAFHKWDKDVFVKPARLGSALGISRVSDEKDYLQALKQAFQFDSHVMVEPVMHGRELEVAVLGSRGQYQIAGPAEIITDGTFYSYDQKYADSSTTKLMPKANLPEEVATTIREIAIQIATALTCEGMVRVDGFLTKSGDYFFSEANTIPGFTSISQYPQMWEANGKELPELLNDLIDLAVSRQKLQSSLQRTSM